DVVFFFFSSRRRHTRFSRDWSSDVCSSDLVQTLPRHREDSGTTDRPERPAGFGTDADATTPELLTRHARLPQPEHLAAAINALFRDAADDDRTSDRTRQSRLRLARPDAVAGYPRLYPGAR